MMEWIAYGEDWEFTSEDGPPSAVPPWGALVIVNRNDDVGRQIIWHPEKGFFVWADEHGEWDVKDFTGLLDFLANFPGCIVRMARGVPTSTFRTVLQRAIDDPRLPPKSGWLQGEERL